MVFDLMPAACSSVPPLDGSQQASHRTALSGIVSTAEPLIRLPVHALGLLGDASDMTVLPPNHILIFCALSTSRRYKASRWLA